MVGIIKFIYNQAWKQYLILSGPGNNTQALADREECSGPQDVVQVSAAAA
jgi:hypothetical protein